MATEQARSGEGGATVMKGERRKITWQYAAVSYATPGLIIAKAPDLGELNRQLNEMRLAPRDYYIKCLLPPGVVPMV